ncbi:MAG TPA: diguanylate cyclase [Thermoleophilaceae bacterium]|nr:diguanylate cyclase [Thermoleophilaceae bacterium]
MDPDAIRSVAAVTARTFAGFSEATREVLSLLEAHLPGTAVFAARFDRERNELVVVHATGDASFGLESGVASPLDDSFCIRMASDRAPRLCNDVASDPEYSWVPGQSELNIASYVGMPLELSDGERVGSLCALAHDLDRFSESDLELLTLMARILSQDLEREQRERRLESANELLEQQANDLTVLGRVSRTLATSADARSAVCDAACELTGASVSILYEPSGDGGLEPTAASGKNIPPIDMTVSAEEPSGAVRVYRTNATLVLDEAQSRPEVANRLARALGVNSCVFEPVAVKHDVLGVLVVAWAEAHPPTRERTLTLVRLLAAEAAVAIERADTEAELQELANTDDLTGLPNRRAWESELVRAVGRARRRSEPLAIALVDLDHFKAYNDERGHQAGDRILRECTAAWRATLRDDDVLARYGGEEFGVILPSCDPFRAHAVIERLRTATPDGLTCSAGVAHWDGSEARSALVSRADAALYSAKQSGRDATATAA